MLASIDAATRARMAMALFHSLRQLERRRLGAFRRPAGTTLLELRHFAAPRQVLQTPPPAAHRFMANFDFVAAPTGCVSDTLRMCWRSWSAARARC